MGFAPTWLRQVSPLFHKTTLTTDEREKIEAHTLTHPDSVELPLLVRSRT